MSELSIEENVGGVDAGFACLVILGWFHYLAASPEQLVREFAEDSRHSCRAELLVIARAFDLKTKSVHCSLSFLIHTPLLAIAVIVGGRFFIVALVYDRWTCVLILIRSQVSLAGDLTHFDSLSLFTSNTSRCQQSATDVLRAADFCPEFAVLLGSDEQGANQSQPALLGCNRYWSARYPAVRDVTVRFALLCVRPHLQLHRWETGRPVVSLLGAVALAYFESLQGGHHLRLHCLNEEGSNEQAERDLLSRYRQTWLYYWGSCHVKDVPPRLTDEVQFLSPALTVQEQPVLRTQRYVAMGTTVRILARVNASGWYTAHEPN